MATSGRRFKAVFAGLHQVQRFHDSSNTPVAHGGDDILVGPLAQHGRLPPRRRPDERPGLQVRIT